MIIDEIEDEQKGAITEQNRLTYTLTKTLSLKAQALIFFLPNFEIIVSRETVRLIVTSVVSLFVWDFQSSFSSADFVSLAGGGDKPGTNDPGMKYP